MKSSFLLFNLLLFPFLYLLKNYPRKLHNKKVESKLSKIKSILLKVLFLFTFVAIQSNAALCTACPNSGLCNSETKCSIYSAQCSWDGTNGECIDIPNTPPTASDQNVVTNEDTAVTITLSGSDADGDTLIYTIFAGPSHGTLSGAEPNIVYTPNSGYTGSDVFTYKTYDGTDYSAEATVTITVTATGNLPCANPKVFSPIYRTVARGNIKLIGNTNICRPQDNNSSTGICIDPGDATNNSTNAIWRDGDIVSSTLNSSSAKLVLSDDAEILWAGLYWQGYFSGTLTDTIQQTATTIKLGYSTDNADHNINYTDITADRLNHVYFSDSRWYYQGFKDITEYLKSHGKGWFWGADIKTTLGKPPGGTLGAWSIAIVYKDDAETMKNLSIYDGYLGFAGDGDINGAKAYAQANNCAEDNTGVQHEFSISLSNFLTPKSGDVNSTLLFFAGEGDIGLSGDNIYLADKSGTFHQITNAVNPTNNIANSSISEYGVFREQSLLYPYYGYNTIGIDIDTFDVSNIIENSQYATAVKMNTVGDGYFPGLFGLSTELYVPDLCYDYAYQQNGRYFTEENNGTQFPTITGDLFSSDPVNVSLFIKNRDASDIVISDMRVNIDPIDTSEGTYIDGSVKVTLPGEIQREDTTISTSAASYIKGIQIGDVGSEEYFYTYYALHPLESSIDMPLKANLDFNTTITIPNGPTITSRYEDLNIHTDIPFCADGGYGYGPIYGTFNVEQNAANGKYNIFTQVARRIENFKVKAYSADDVNTPINVTVTVGVELIDAGAFHESQTTCQEPDSVLTPRVWVTFDNNVSETDFNKAVIDAAIAGGWISDQILLNPPNPPIDEAEDFFDNIRRSTAFRISYGTLGNGEEIIKLDDVPCANNNGGSSHTCYNVLNFPDASHIDLGAGNGNCLGDLSNGQDKITEWCNNAGRSNASAMTKEKLAQCMECVYGYNLHYICSRDNFAIRPEAFKVSLSDDNTSTLNPDFANNTNKSGSTVSPFNLVAGYPYRFDINATSHTDEHPVKGYVQNFDSSDPQKRAYMAWNPQIITSAESDTYCNAPEDRNMSFYLINGTNTNANPLNTWDDRHDSLNNVGEYAFKVVDEEWTKYDWEENLTQHHTGAHFIGYATPDCLKENPPNNSVPATLGSRVGCETSSVHNGAFIYSEVNIRSHPYSFDVSGLSIGARPGNDNTSNTFVYINTLDKTLYPNNEDENMSYNVQGTFSAVGYDNSKLSNFVNNCYAEPVDMELLYNYNHTPPPNNLTYDLFDYNISSYTRANNTLPSDNIIAQTANNFAKGMEGSLRMDLGYNYARTYNTQVNPISVSMNDFNISYTTQPNQLYVEGTNNHKIFGNVDVDQNVTFVYARAKPGRFFYDDVTTNSIRTPVSVIVYCDLGVKNCQDRGVPLMGAQTNESNWWKSVDHDNVTDKDGNIALSIPTSGSFTSGTVQSVAANIDTLGTDSNPITVFYKSGSKPITIPIDLVVNDPLNPPTPSNYTDRWLIYNPYSATIIPSPFYKVRFIGSSVWTGVGKTGNVVNTNISTKKSRRLDW